MGLFIGILIVVSAFVALWLWRNLPNKFFQFVVGTIAIIFGVAVGISSGESSTYRNAVAACFLCVIGFYLLIRLIDWFLIITGNGEKSLFEKKEEK